MSRHIQASQPIPLVPVLLLGMEEVVNHYKKLQNTEKERAG